MKELHRPLYMQADGAEFTVTRSDFQSERHFASFLRNLLERELTDSFRGKIEAALNDYEKRELLQKTGQEAQGSA